MTLFCHTEAKPKGLLWRFFADAQNDTLFVTLFLPVTLFLATHFLPVPFFTNHPFFICHPEGFSPKGLLRGFFTPLALRSEWPLFCHSEGVNPPRRCPERRNSLITGFKEKTEERRRFFADAQNDTLFVTLFFTCYPFSCNTFFTCSFFYQSPFFYLSPWGL